MNAERQHWIWIFGEIAGLRWVLENDTMAFTDSARRRIPGMSKGDKAVLYVSRSAFHNPGRDMTHLAGIVEVDGELRSVDEIEIGGRSYQWVVPIRKEIVLPLRTGPLVKPLVERLSFVRKPASWGAYFRQSPIGISMSDFDILRSEVLSARDRRP